MHPAKLVLFTCRLLSGPLAAVPDAGALCAEIERATNAYLQDAERRAAVASLADRDLYRTMFPGFGAPEDPADPRLLAVARGRQAVRPPS